MKNEKMVEDILANHRDIVVTKGQDYSDDNLLMQGMPGLATRLVDKVVRLRNLVEKAGRGEAPNHESINDTLDDLSIYGMIGSLMLKGGVYPTTRMVYLAGPIDDVSSLAARGWRAAVAGSLARAGMSVFNPATAYTVGNPAWVTSKVLAINDVAMSECDVMIANLGGEGKAVGTIREIEKFRSMGGRVIVVLGDDVARFGLSDCEVVPDIASAVVRLTGNAEE